jgi:hypothetical protein
VPDECETPVAGVLIAENLDAGLPSGWTIAGTMQITETVWRIPAG